MNVATELEDPFGEIDPSSLLSQTLAGTSGAKASVLDPEGLEPTRSVFESMAIKGYSTLLLEQAQTIVNRSTDLENLYSEDRDGPIVANDKNHAQERRPALGRKRAKFSLKPMPSNSFPTIDVSSIDHIEDPEEFFSAVEQLENAEKELKKLRGETSTNLMQHPTTTARKRRPGLLGKTARYKHQFSAIDFTTEALVESQELKKSDGVVLNNVSHSETTNQCGTLGTNNADNKHQDATERAGSAANEEEETNDLDNILSSIEGLDDNEGATLLRETLQIKSINVGKICLPDMSTIQKFDLKVLDSKVTNGQLKSSQFSKTSPMLKESPFAGIAALHRRASLKDPLKDLYSEPPSDDESCSGDSSLSRGSGRKSLSPKEVDSHDQSGLVASGSFSLATENGVQLSFVDEMHLPLLQADGITTCRVTSDKHLVSPVDSHDQSGLDASGSFSLATGNGVQLSFVDEMHSPVVQADGITSCIVTSEKQLPLDRSNGVDMDKDIVSGDLDGCLQEEHNNIQVDPSVFDHQDAGVGALNSGMENLARSPHRDMGGNCSSFGINNDTALGSDDTSHTKVYTTAEDALSLQVLEDSSIPSKEIPAVNQNGFSSLPTGNDEGQQMASRASPNRRNEKANRRRNQTVARRRDKKSSISRRQSLAGAGTFWDPKSGRRKSSRATCKPLEYWRGERFLYGRIHESMTTIIGVKRASPGKSGLQVKSFVSPQYADLVAQAALH